MTSRVVSRQVLNVVTAGRYLWTIMMHAQRRRQYPCPLKIPEWFFVKFTIVLACHKLSLWLWKWTCPVSFSECGQSLSMWKRAVISVLIAIQKPCFRAPAGWKFLNGMGAAVDSGSNCCPVLLIRAGGREGALLGYSLTAPLMNNLPEGAAHSSIWAWWNYPHPCRLISKKCAWHLVGKKTLPLRLAGV